MQISESKYFRLNDDPQLPIAFYCPGCECNHGINETWKITFNSDKPTVSPSILVKHGKYLDLDRPIETYKKIVCHSFIRDGKIEFLNDCTHELAGKTVEMKLFD